MFSGRKGQHRNGRAGCRRGGSKFVEKKPGVLGRPRDLWRHAAARERAPFRLKREGGFSIKDAMQQHRAAPRLLWLLNTRKGVMVLREIAERSPHAIGLVCSYRDPTVSEDYAAQIAQYCQR